jgi:hypothetical protein
MESTRADLAAKHSLQGLLKRTHSICKGNGVATPAASGDAWRHHSSHTGIGGGLGRGGGGLGCGRGDALGCGPVAGMGSEEGGSGLGDGTGGSSGGMKGGLGGGGGALGGDGGGSTPFLFDALDAAADVHADPSHFGTTSDRLVSSSRYSCCLVIRSHPCSPMLAVPKKIGLSACMLSMVAIDAFATADAQTTVHGWHTCRSSGKAQLARTAAADSQHLQRERRCHS